MGGAPVTDTTAAGSPPGAGATATGAAAATATAGNGAGRLGPCRRPNVSGVLAVLFVAVMTV